MLEEQSKQDGQKPKRRAITSEIKHAEATQPDNVTRYYLILFQDGEYIDRGIVRDIQQQLDEMITTPPEETEIDIWIESFGGDAHAAYKLVIDLRHRCRRLQAVVPDIAKSAATLVLLGVDKIFMGAAAELGPLDVQISHPDREEVIISAIDVADSLEFLGETAFGLVISGGAGVVHYTGLRRSEVLGATLPFVAQLLQPIIAKVDPHILHQATNQLRVAERYAINLLKTRSIEQLEELRALGLVDHLIHHYPAHEFVISRKEARKMGLPIENIESYPKWQILKRFYSNFLAGEESIVCVLDDLILEKMNTPAHKNAQENGHETDIQSTIQEAQQEANKADRGSESTSLTARA